MARRRRLIPAQPGYLAPVSEDTARIAPIAQVSGQSAEAAALREMQDGLQTARDEGRMIVDVPLTDVAPSFLIRDRIVLDRDELEALKTSIHTYGQRTPAEIAPLAAGCFARETSDGEAPEMDGSTVYKFGLVSGWRRLTALNELFAETGELRFSTLRALIQPRRIMAENYAAMVEENEIRVGLSYYERARLVAQLTVNGVFSDQSTALKVLFGTASRAKRSKISSFVTLYETLDDVLRFPTAIGERLGLALVAQLRVDEGQQRLRQALKKAAPATESAEIGLLEQLARPPKSAAVSRVKPEVEELAPGVTMRLSHEKEGSTVVLSGPGIDAALLVRLRAALATSG